MYPKNIYSEYSLSRIHTDWACLTSQDYRMRDIAFRLEAFSYASQLMRQVREELLRIIELLYKQNYHFVNEEKVIGSPQKNVCEMVNRYNQKGIYIPLIYEAWLSEVGSVNLIGTHPEWGVPAYANDGIGDTTEILYTDPLVVECDESYINYLFQEWEVETSSRNKPCKPPFRLEVSPDHLHKANISGGMPYQLSTDKLAIDTILLNERHGMTFFGYLKHSLTWGGFPGFDYIAKDNRYDWEQLSIMV